VTATGHDDLHMTAAAERAPNGRIMAAEPVIIAIDQPASGRHDAHAEAKAFVDLIAEALPPDTLLEVFARLAAALADRTNVLTVVSTAVRGMER
jgi:hypothetical protein